MFWGKLHPLAVHFPIALILVALFLEFAKRKEAARFFLVLGAIGAVVAAVLGWISAMDAPDSDTLSTHRTLGILVAAASCITAFIRRPALFRIALVISAGLVAVGAHYGGLLVHGSWSTPEPSKETAHEIFKQSCYSCHGPAKQQAGLRLDSKESAHKVIASGKLMERILGHGKEDRMPLKAPPLSDSQIAIVREWIEKGADWPNSVEVKKHWAYVKPVRPPGNSIDDFVRERAPEAPRDTLIRRVFLDLTGLPPTIQDMDSSETYEQIVDRLLASPHYGERWARPWLDWARFADSHGWERDRPRPMWKYRDWVIQALNDDMSFKQFTIEQIAGDMLPNPTIDQRIATGFNRNSQWNEEGGVDPEEVMFESLVDRVNTTATVWLGMTLGCAQCHNHKFDPIPQKDYYQFMAFFANTESTPYIDPLDATPRYREPFLEFFTPEQETQRSVLLSELAQWESQYHSMDLTAAQAEWEKNAASMWTLDKLPSVTAIKIEVLEGDFRLRRASVEGSDGLLARFTTIVSATTRDMQEFRASGCAAPEIVLVAAKPIAGPEIQYRLKVDGNAKYRIWVTSHPDPALGFIPKENKDVFFRSMTPLLKEVREKIAEKRKALSQIKPVTTTMVMRERNTGERPWTYLRNRGNFLAKGDKVYANPPSALPPLPDSELPNRLGLARWLVDESNPLTARVIVNRIWEQYFGRGLVETSEDFGTQGQRPSHPELLDWLAVEFMEKGWSLKKLHRQIVLSATYRQSSKVNNAERDPHNRTLARGPRFRMEAEMIRDSALAASGLLSRKMGGPSVYPYQPDGIWSSAFTNFTGNWIASQGEDRYRRAVYTFWKRASPYPSFVSFDAPSREVCTVRRARSNTPLQALTTLNDPAYVEAAKALASRMVAHSDDPRKRIEFGFRLCTARKLKPTELDRLVKLSEQITDPEWTWPAVANVLLNLDETLTKE